MRIRRGMVIGIIAAVLIMIGGGVALYIGSKNLAYFLIGIGFLIGLFPFVIYSVIEGKIEREKDEKFIDFSRSLVESVESGTPISRGIINMRSKNFGSLSPHIEKLANQIELGIPMQQALRIFAKDTKSRTIMRAITLIREADKTGGNIDTILEAVAKSVTETEKLKAERRAAISSIVIEGYIIFLVFIIIMVVMEFSIIPKVVAIGSMTADNPRGAGFGGINPQKIDPAEFSLAFLALLITQGFFAGLVIGKLSEGNILAGLKHSFVMVALAIIISTGARLII